MGIGDRASRGARLAALGAAMASAGLPATAAGAGGLDRSFDRDGVARFALPGVGIEAVRFVAPLPDGGLLVAGQLRPQDGYAQFVVRVTPDGRRGAVSRIEQDPSVGQGAVAAQVLPPPITPPVPSVPPPAPLPAPGPFDLAADARGRALVLRSAGAESEIVRLTPAGRLDGSFGTGGRAALPFGAGRIVTTADGRILVGGGSATAPHVALVARLREDGSLDPAFGAGGIARLTPPIDGLSAQVGTYALSIGADGRILVAGSIFVEKGSAFQGRLADWYARLTPAGAVDPGFGAGLPVTPPAQFARPVLQADGGVAYAVGRRLARGVFPIAVRRLTPAGVPDPAFGTASAPVGPKRDARVVLLRAPGGRLVALRGTIALVVDATGRRVRGVGVGQAGVLRVPGRAPFETTATIDVRGRLVVLGDGPGVRLVRLRLT